MNLAITIDAVGESTVIHPGVEVFREGEAEGRGIFVGSNCILYPRNRLVLGNLAVNTEANMVIGDHVLINAGGYFSGEGGLYIGDFTLIGPSACLLSAGHEFDNMDAPIQYQRLAYGRVEVGRDVWIGASAVVLPGVSIGDGAVVASGSVVTQSVPTKALVAGNPARLVRFRGEQRKNGLVGRMRKAWKALCAG
jgi:galactoside O-acetyltransferase